MKTLIQLLEIDVRVILTDIGKKTGQNSYRKGQEQYLSLLVQSLNRYEHHQGQKINEYDLQKRFQAETALLHLITKILQASSSHLFTHWPVDEEASPYKWYQIPSNLPLNLNQIIRNLSKQNSLALFLSEISGEILNKVCKRYNGEFYTPLSIAEHLIQLSGVEPKDILIDGKKVIDPACGGGIILISIAEKMIAYSRTSNQPPSHVLEMLSKNLFGFDVQPFAVLFTKSLLVYQCISLISASEYSSQSLFPNIRVQDTLITYEQYWLNNDGSCQTTNENRGFDFLIGNPPFMSAKGGRLDYLEQYSKVLYGHPNLYQLFLWWAIRAATPGAIISFLLPQSMLAGNYFKNLRKQIDIETNIISITRIIDHTGVIGEADIQMMVLCLEINRDKSDKENSIDILVVRNGNDIIESNSFSAQYSQVVKKLDSSIVFWVVSDETKDYEICSLLESKCIDMSDLGHLFKIGNGSYVWNQHKKLVREQEDSDTLPLISAASIGLFDFTFPYFGPHPCHTRNFSIKDSLEGKNYSGPSILVQRTTPRKIGRRIVASMISEKFCNNYPQYFLENHVNYIKATDNTYTTKLIGLLGWINSDLINFIFQLRNGSTLVSVYELGLLPINLAMVERLIYPTRKLLGTKGHDRIENIQTLNTIIYEWLELSSEHRERITIVLDRNER